MVWYGMVGFTCQAIDLNTAKYHRRIVAEILRVHAH